MTESSKSNVELEDHSEEIGSQSKGEDLNAEQKKLNEIRNLLFGQNVQEYRSEFEELKAIIQKNKSEAEQTIAEMKSNFESTLNSLERNFEDQLTSSNRETNIRLDELDDNKVDRVKMASMLHELANQLEK